MKYIFLFILTFTMSFFSFAQEEVRREVDNELGYELYLKYKLNNQEESMAMADITEVMGAPSGHSWSTAKNNDQYVIVKVLNGFVFVRGYDRTEEGEISAKLRDLDSKLKKYSDL